MKKILTIIMFCTAPLAADRVSDLDQFIARALEEWGIPGAAVSVVEGDQVLLSKGYGIAKLGDSASVNEDTIFQLASITKTFTAAGIAVQVEQGEFSWDEEVIDRLPRFVLKDIYATRYATARDLLAHRTGLPAFGGDLLGKLGYTNEEILHRVRFIEPAGSFRDKPHYSNVGFFLAGELLSALSGLSWQETIQKTLLTPLSMDRSGFGSNLDNPNAAYPHALKDNKLVVLTWDRTGGFDAAGAITSTAADMSKWMRMLVNGGLLKLETIAQMFRSSMPGEVSFSEAPPIDDYSGFSYGLGWNNYHYSGLLIVEKGGGLDGIRTVTTLVPQKLGITVLCNLNLTLFPEAVRAYFLEQFVAPSPNDLQAAIHKEQKSLDTLLAQPERPSHPLPPLPLDVYAGTFSSELYGDFRIVPQNDTLTVQAGPAAYPGSLEHFSGNTFTLTWPAVNSGNQQVTFTIGPEGRAVAFNTETLGKFILNDVEKSPLNKEAPII